jgi:hypothetical protein
MTSRATTNDDRVVTLSAWCAQCRSSQPCAPTRTSADASAASPYRCVTCGQVAPNPVLRLPVRPSGEVTAQG